MKNKKILLGLGAIASVATPAIAVVSCGDKAGFPKIHVTAPTTKGQHNYTVAITLPTTKAPTVTEIGSALSNGNIEIAKFQKLIESETAKIKAAGSNDPQAAVQALVDAFYRIGQVDITYTVGFNTSTSNFTIQMDLTEFLDIDAINAVDNESDMVSLEMNMIQKMTQSISKWSTFYVQLVDDSVYKTWVAQITNKATLGLITANNQTLYAGATVQQAKDFMLKAFGITVS